jgi:hypothetical protein
MSVEQFFSNNEQNNNLNNLQTLISEIPQEKPHGQHRRKKPKIQQPVQEQQAPLPQPTENQQQQTGFLFQKSIILFFVILLLNNHKQ